MTDDVIDHDRVERDEKRFLSVTQCTPKEATPAQWARLVAFAVDDFTRAFEASGQPADGGGAGGFGDGKPTTAPAPGCDDAQLAELCNHLGGMGIRHVELLRNYPGTGGSIGVEYGQPHDDAQSQIGELRQLHDPNLHNSHLG